MSKKLVKFFILLICFIFSITLVSCGLDIDIDPYKDGIEPKNDFTIS